MEYKEKKQFDDLQYNINISDLKKIKVLPDEERSFIVIDDKIYYNKDCSYEFNDKLISAIIEDDSILKYIEKCFLNNCEITIIPYYKSFDDTASLDRKFSLYKFYELLNRNKEKFGNSYESRLKVILECIKNRNEELMKDLNDEENGNYKINLLSVFSLPEDELINRIKNNNIIDGLTYDEFRKIMSEEPFYINLYIKKDDNNNNILNKYIYLINKNNINIFKFGQRYNDKYLVYEMIKPLLPYLYNLNNESSNDYSVFVKGIYFDCNMYDEKYICHLLIDNVDKIIENNIDIEIFKIILNYLHDNFNVITNINFINMLKSSIVDMMTKPDTNYSYIDAILEHVKNNPGDINLNMLLPNEKKFAALFYIKLSKYNMIPYVEDVTKESLLSKGFNDKNLLEYLLEFGSLELIDDIIPVDLISEPEIYSLLLNNGYKNKYKAFFPDETLDDKYIDEYNDRMRNIKISLSSKILLHKMKMLFLKDKKSDIKAIDALICAYKQALIYNYDLAIGEIKQIIKIKQNNYNEFYYIYNNEERPHFDGESVFLDRCLPSVILHETGHVFHNYNAQYAQPSDFFDIIRKISMDPAVREKAKDFLIKFRVLRDNISKNVEKKYDEKNDDKIANIITSLKMKYKNKFIQLGLQDKTIDMILSNSITGEEYIANKRKNYINEKTDVIIRTKYAIYPAISDILDAVYNGTIVDGRFGIGKYSDYGHGISYYSRYEKDYSSKFMEIVAEYSVILKSPAKDEGLNILKEILGEEFCNMIEAFYYENITGEFSHSFFEGKVK